MRLIELMVRIVPALRGCLRVVDRHREVIVERVVRGRKKVVLCHCCLHVKY